MCIAFVSHVVGIVDFVLDVPGDKRKKKLAHVQYKNDIEFQN